MSCAASRAPRSRDRPAVAKARGVSKLACGDSRSWSSMGMRVGIGVAGRRLAALCIGGLLAGSAPARAAPSEIGDEPVSAGYRMQVFDGQIKRDPYRLYVLVRLAPQNGMLK